MSPPILATKLYIPQPRPKLVPRPRLITRLNEGLHHRLTLISAPAGFGKTMLVSEWVHALTAARPPKTVAWLSLDEADSDPVRFLTYLVAALQTLDPEVGAGVLSLLRSPQSLPTETVLVALLNDISAIARDFVLVLDDYHRVDARAVDQILAFLLEHAPPEMHLVITTREDPQFPLARLRAQGQLTELRFADLRFTDDETSEFLNQVMDLELSAADVASIASRTEGWIAGLQLAAVSMVGRSNASAFIASFAGSHRFVLDYLLEEVLDQQPEDIRIFLLRTSILDRLTGDLCDAVTGQTGGQQMLDHLERANLFVVPMDAERRWYRYHHLFADLLRHRLQQSGAASAPDGAPGIDALHCRASIWYEAHGLEVEAFEHAAAANDVARASRLIEGGGTPLQYRGAMTRVLGWLESLPVTVLDATPSLWVNYASALTMVGRMPEEIEEKLAAAESALANAQPGKETENLIGRIAALRAMLAIPQSRADFVVTQAHLALAHLSPDHLLARTAAHWALGYGYQLQGDLAAAREVYKATIPVSQASGNLLITIGATVALGQIEEEENQLRAAEKSYRQVLVLAGDPPLPFACAAHFGLARLAYEWNDLDAAEAHDTQSLALGQQLPNTDTQVSCMVLRAQVRLARKDVAGSESRFAGSEGRFAAASSQLAEAEAFAREHGFTHLLPEVAAVQALIRLQQGDVAGAAGLVVDYDLPLTKARIAIAAGDAPAALALLGRHRRQTEAAGQWREHLKGRVLQAVALAATGEREAALRVLADALALAEPEGDIRTFIDEGPVVAQLLSEARDRGVMPAYTGKLLAAAAAPAGAEEGAPPDTTAQQPLVEPLSERELEVLRLIAEGLTNRQIAERLFITLSTVKGHNQRIFGKLQARRRTEAVARARELGLI